MLKYFILLLVCFLSLNAASHNTKTYHKKHTTKKIYHKKIHHKKTVRHKKVHHKKIHHKYKHKTYHKKVYHRYKHKTRFINTKAKYKIGLEVGLATFKSKTIETDTLKQSTTTYEKTAQGIDTALVFQYYDFSCRLGIVKFLSEPISSAKDLDFDKAYWSPNSKGYYYTQLGYAYDFDKKHRTKLHKYFFVDLGLGVYDFDNIKFKNLATSTGAYQKNCKDFTCNKSSDYLPSFYGDFGLKMTYFYKSIALNLKVKVNLLSIKAYEGSYNADSSTSVSFAYEINAESSANFGISYIF